jgi:hypothetical protein
MEAEDIEDNRLPQAKSLEELWAWVAPLTEAERVGDRGDDFGSNAV